MAAPEGSDERKDARRTLYHLTQRAIVQLGVDPDEWLQTVAETFPSLLRSVGEEDMRAIIQVALGQRRRLLGF